MQKTLGERMKKQQSDMRVIHKAGNPPLKAVKKCSEDFLKKLKNK